jgi:multidrug efflux system membrane fusion protein
MPDPKATAKANFDISHRTRGSHIRSQIRRHWAVSALMLVAVLIGAWLVIRWAVTPKAKPSAPPAIAVSAATVASGDVPVFVTALGAAQAWTSDIILAQVSGKLLSVDFIEGTDVKAGQLLAQVDPAPYRAMLTQARGALERDRALLGAARIDLQRYQTLLAEDSIARQTYDDQAALVKQDQGTVLVDEGVVATSQINLMWCRITSPIAGRTGVRMVDPGNLVTASQAPTSTTSTTTAPLGIVVVNQIQPIAVTFSVPQGDYQRLSELSDGFHKPLATQALSQETGASLGSGALSIADNRVDPTTGSVKMKARFANTDERLLPGQFVNIKLTLQTLMHATTIPAAAVNQGPNGTFVYVIGSDLKVAMRSIKISLTQDTTAVIVAGLKPGETVVTDGQMSLTAGSAVKVKPPVPAPPPVP